MFTELRGNKLLSNVMFTELRGNKLLSNVMFMELCEINCFLMFTELRGNKLLSNVMFTELRGNKLLSNVMFGEINCFLMLCLPNFGEIHCFLMSSVKGKHRAKRTPSSFISLRKGLFKSIPVGFPYR